MARHSLREEKAGDVGQMPQYAKKARPIGRALFGAIIAIHTARVTLPLRRQRVHA